MIKRFLLESYIYIYIVKKSADPCIWRSLLDHTIVQWKLQEPSHGVSGSFM